MGGKEYAIGIDLGTTYSCVGVWEHNRVEIITNDQGNRTTPSYVAFTPYDRLIGDTAKNQAATNPTNTIYDAKRLIGRRFTDEIVQNDIKLWPFKVLSCGTKDCKPMIVVTYKGDEKHFTAEEISAMVLMKMKETAESYLGCEVKDAVVTVPAYFSDSQRQATKDAGKIAGLNVMRILNEPTAAAIAYVLEKKGADKNVKRNLLVFDLGGGTFDVSLVKVGEESEDLFEVKAISGNTHLGGGDFNNRLVNHFVAELKSKHNVDITGNPRSLARLTRACERAKRALSSTTEAAVDIDYLYEGIDFCSVISRDRFEMLNKDLFEDCLKLVVSCLGDAKMEKGDIDEIVLVGGSTRIPMIQRLLKEFFNGKELCKSLNPDEAVAYGAAIYAAVLNGVRLNQHVMLVDVTPLSLGVELLGGELSVVIPRNTPIPVKIEKNFKTAYNNRPAVRITVYEGENTIANLNNRLGSFDLWGISSTPEEVTKVAVCFTIDDNGILTVTSRDRSSGSSSQITLTNHSGRLLKSSIDMMAEEAKAYMANRKEVKTAKANLVNYVHQVRDIMNDVCGEIEVQEKKMVEAALEQAIRWLECNIELTDVSKFEEKLTEVSGICYPVILKLASEE